MTTTRRQCCATKTTTTTTTRRTEAYYYSLLVVFDGRKRNATKVRAYARDYPTYDELGDGFNRGVGGWRDKHPADERGTRRRIFSSPIEYHNNNNNNNNNRKEDINNIIIIAAAVQSLSPQLSPLPRAII